MELFKKKNKSGKKGISKLLVFLITLGISVVVLLIVSSIESEAVKTKEKKTNSRIVSVVKVTPSSYPATVKTMGEVNPEWQSEISSQVSGKVKRISPKFRLGKVMQKGDVLVEIEASEYEAFLADANVRLSAAKINLLQTEKAAEDAMLNWKRSGIEGNPNSPLVLHKPQLEAAQNEVKAAEKAVIKAELDLSNTKITAPFNGVIANRQIDLGEALTIGSPVAEFYGIDKAVVTVFVNSKQWKLISANLRNIKAKLSDTNTQEVWQSNNVREGKIFDNTTRLKPIIIEVNHPFARKNKLMAGSFLKVELQGEEIPNLIKVSETVLTKGGYIWYVDQNNKLRSMKIDPLFHANGDLYFELPKNVQIPVQISINPNSTFMNGFTVEPKLSKGEL